MELVAASKMRKAQDQMQRSRPYSEKILQVISHVARSHSEYQHPFLVKRDKINRAGYIVVSSDRGLCGPLNVVLFKAILKHMQENHEDATNVDVIPIGRKAENLFVRMDSNIAAQADHLGDAPAISDLVGIVKVLLDDYERGKIDVLYLCSNEFVNTMQQKPKIQQILPLVAAEGESYDYYWDYIYEDNSRELLDALLRRYVESQVYQAVVENLACEQAARMVAMKSATENAGDIIKRLNLAYNKARQASITREISEIVAGSDAISN